MMLVTTEELAGKIGDASWVVFDCRHDLTDTLRGARVYREGHIPGAHFAAVDHDLSGRKTGTNGRHPLPEPGAFAAFLGRHGVEPGMTIVAYDDAGGLYAARLWWMARWIGLERVALLDGGISKWSSEGRPLSAVVPMLGAQPTSPLVAPEGAMGLWSADDVARRIGDRRSLLIDARAAERYRGETESIDPVAGHIPGAANRFYKANLKPDLTFRPAEELRREFETLLGGREVAEVGHQCGSGITACANLFAMEYAGLRGSKLYAGSWSEWVSDGKRPVERG